MLELEPAKRIKILRRQGVSIRGIAAVPEAVFEDAGPLTAIGQAQFMDRVELGVPGNAAKVTPADRSRTPG